MAYQELTAASAVMNREIAQTRHFFARIGDWLASIGQSVSWASAAQARFDQVQALQSKSDAELAALNIKRDEIVHLVFKDLYYV